SAKLTGRWPFDHVAQSQCKNRQQPSKQQCATTGTRVFVSRNNERVIKGPAQNEQYQKAPPPYLELHATTHREDDAERHRKASDVAQQSKVGRSETGRH